MSDSTLNARRDTVAASPLPARRIRFDLLSFGGLALAAFAILGGQWIEGGVIGSLLQGAAFVIVVGGTIGAVMLQSPRETFRRGIALARWTITPPHVDHEAAIRRITEWASIARTHGTLMLESRMKSCDDAFMRTGLAMVVDGFRADKIREALDVEISNYADRQRAAARIWEAAGGYAPTIGILGAVLGLIHVVENLADPSKLGNGIAVAFVATIYGVALANLVLLPIAAKLRALIDTQILHRELVLDGLVGISNREHPKLIEFRLRGYLA